MEQIKIDISKRLVITLKQSEMACRSIVREALKGITEANNPTIEADIRKAVEFGISRYYLTWGDNMIKFVTNHFMEAYMEIVNVK